MSFTNCSYCASEISPLRHFVLVCLTSAVCGKLPIVVVGSNGSLNSSSCFLIRSANGNTRSASAFVKLSVELFTFSFLLYSEWFSASSASLLSLKVAPASSFPFANAITSCNFSSANDKPPIITGSKASSNVFVTGTCRIEQDGCTISRSSGTICLIESSKAFFSSRFALHTLRPSTIPAASTLSAGNPDSFN